MASRTSSRQVTFHRPFWVSGLDCRQSAGTYTVDTKEESVEARSFQSWQHVATMMRIARDGNINHVRINRDELDDALARDAEKVAVLRVAGKSDAGYDLL